VGGAVSGPAAWVVKKESFTALGDPWTIQGIPLAWPSSVNGFTYGVTALAQNIRRQDPHLVQLEAQLLTSARGRWDNFLIADVPHMFDGSFRSVFGVRYKKDFDSRFFGIGNDTTVDQQRIEDDDVLYQNNRTRPIVDLIFLKRFGKYFSTGPTMGFKWMTIFAPPGSLLAFESPLGIGGGNTHYLGWAMVISTLDFEAYPSDGVWHEIFYAYYNEFIGSDYNFQAATYTYRRYLRLADELILAYRNLFEVLWGEVPFYELGPVRGTDPSFDSGGGNRFLRGFEENQFIDNVKMWMGLELRWDFKRTTFMNQPFVIGLVPFFDIGRVWDKFFPLDFSNLHASAGLGARLIWNRLVGRMDVAATKQGSTIYLTIGNTF